MMLFAPAESVRRQTPVLSNSASSIGLNTLGDGFGGHMGIPYTNSNNS